MIFEIGIKNCDMTADQFDKARFEAAAQQYGELLGMRVMEKAMRAIGF